MTLSPEIFLLNQQTQSALEQEALEGFFNNLLDRLGASMADTMDSLVKRMTPIDKQKVANYTRRDLVEIKLIIPELDFAKYGKRLFTVQSNFNGNLKDYSADLSHFGSAYYDQVKKLIKDQTRQIGALANKQSFVLDIDERELKETERQKVVLKALYAKHTKEGNKALRLMDLYDAPNEILKHMESYRKLPNYMVIKELDNMSDIINAYQTALAVVNRHLVTSSSKDAQASIKSLSAIYTRVADAITELSVIGYRSLTTAATLNNIIKGLRKDFA